MVSSQLQTFTNSWQGLYNPKMREIMSEFREECQPIVDKYVNKFSRENIEYCSLNGAFHCMCIYNTIQFVYLHPQVF